MWDLFICMIWYGRVYFRAVLNTNCYEYTNKLLASLSIKLGTPEHGWLAVDIISDDYKLKIDASDVPLDPLEQLCNVILNLNVDKKGEVWWHLEPASVFFEFKKFGQNYRLTIMTADRYESIRTTEKVLTGSFHDIIEPFINSLRLFYSTAYDEKHWPAVDFKKINKLQRLTNDT